MPQQVHELRERNATESYPGFNRHRGVYALQPKSVSIFFVFMFLVGVYMSVSNIRQAISMISIGTLDDGHLLHMDNAVNERVIELPSSEYAYKLFIGNNTDVENGKKNKTSGNEFQKMSSNMIANNKSASSKDNPKNDSLSAKATKRTSDRNSNKTDDGKYEENLEMTISVDPNKLSPQSSFLSVIPNDNNTVITLISMGRLVDTYLVERCIRSIRLRGQFAGIIMVFTDSIGYKRYQDTIPYWDNQTIIIEGRDEDMHPREENTLKPESNHTEPQLKKYRQHTMVFKRFKTHHHKYIVQYPDLSESIRYVMYADVDNIIGNRLDKFFEEYAKVVAVEYQRAIDFHRNATSTTDKGVNESASNSNTSDDIGFGFISIFRDRHLRRKMHRFVSNILLSFFLPVFIFLSLMRFSIHTNAPDWIIHTVVLSFTISPSKRDVWMGGGTKWTLFGTQVIKPCLLGS